ncbi:unnamed protein product [Didymodactylos carnosus]|uniref:Uncharacterized protein n=1 Tax=Didymodactylos carnosus TaxID=1234261 RepID=A0A815W237_9BILA|nr:unnamed protein product [Didymodactylos carnosus]CAF1539433.1 unnamed protein product [Didymodactylos carnosus]CAF4110590.1 unnamed protein product [Didymodactylos carnosus]CAF4399622.1 unnamed protein product [Didymodactylos carnosus]
MIKLVFKIKTTYQAEQFSRNKIRIDSELYEFCSKYGIVKQLKNETDYYLVQFDDYDSCDYLIIDNYYKQFQLLNLDIEIVRMYDDEIDYQREYERQMKHKNEHHYENRY